MSNAEQSEWGKAGRLVAVVVTHNRLDKLKVTIAQLLAQPRPLLQAVVVVDNVSTDGTGDWLAAQDDPRLVVQTSTANIGGAGGFENGMKLAVHRFDPDWLVVMDDDARPEPGALVAFHDLAPIQWDGIAAAVYFPDGQICEMNRPSRNPFWHAREFFRTMFGGGRSGFHLDPAAYEGEAQAIDVTSFVGFFISRAGVQRIGYPDGGLFLYGDDGLYTLGLRKAGGQIGFEPSVRFEHDCSTFGTQTQRGRFVPLWKVYFYHRNLLLLYKMAAGWLFWPALLVILPKWLLKARVHQGERRAFLSLLGLAVLDGLRGDTTRGLDEIQTRAQRAGSAR